MANKGVANRISNGSGVMSKVVTQNSGRLVLDCIEEIKRNADAVRGKGYASKKKKGRG